VSNAGQFVKIFNELSAHLCGVTGLDAGASFSRLVETAAKENTTVRKHASRLKTFGKLRNAIVHDEGYPLEIIAEPVEHAVAEFNAIVEEIRSPALVFPRFQAVVRCFAPEDWLLEVLQYMKEQGYSQVAVRQEGSLRLLTTEGVARYAAEWTPWDPERFQNARVYDALACDLPDGFLIVSAKQSVDDAREAFATELGRGQARLYALLITPSGTETEAPIGIITPWDFLVPPHA